ncbi:hypothetical protein NLJ89_g9672 [Agrocybe chaxingu]|uniref:Serine/threonine-protein kinase RIO2 n=1 Tax=Agrocybe chaxingu TaxID=84603 RepID=A0A9W8JZJ7_9AGAR|nr:hypothetical protein NLJ89_g9672 [Agrocybe chaxingu]
MKLDATDLRYVTSDEFRVLTAVEMGSKNHEIVPLSLIVQISGLRNGGVNKLVGSLAKRNLISKVQNAKYDGYRLTYGGYDYLAMRALSKRDAMHSVGNQIGVGKESDIYIVADAEGNEMVLKLHRLGRVSFRAIKEKRDYLGKRKSASWMYMSRLAAQKEWAFMKACLMFSILPQFTEVEKILHEHNFPVPRPIDQARHTILMEFIDAYPLRQVSEVVNPGKLYSELMDVIVRFAQAGLIHGDYNEFNILIRRTTGEPVVIDFPQMVSTSHENAEWYFNRDVEKVLEEGTAEPGFKLDVMVEASGFGRKEMQVLEEYMESVKEQEEQSSEVYSEEESEEEKSEEIEQIQQETIESEDMPSTNLEEGGSVPMTVDAPAPPKYQETMDPSDLSLEALGLSDISDRQLSRSPPQSRRSSPPAADDQSSEEEELEHTGQTPDIKTIVSHDIAKRRTQQQRKHHSRRSARNAGRPQGSKAKQDKRVKLSEHAGLWG